jgi:glutamate-1-semialdehyde 2,1-aminomutase
MKKIKTAAIVQARYDSTRFPGKVCKVVVNNKTLLELLIKRLSRSKKIDEIIVATTKNKNDEKIINICDKLKIKTFLGNDTNVLKRYLDTANKFNIKNIVRITADCPLVDPVIVDKVLELFFKKKLDYCSNLHLETFPDGLDVEVFNFKTLIKANRNTILAHDQEHVTPYMIRDKNIKKDYLYSDKKFSNVRLTVDEDVDLKVVKNIYNHFHPQIHFSWDNILKELKKKI